MNIISQLRSTIQVDGTFTIDIDLYNQLQREWIMRCMDDETLAKHDDEIREKFMDWMIDKWLATSDDKAILLAEYAEKLKKDDEK